MFNTLKIDGNYKISVSMYQYQTLLQVSPLKLLKLKNLLYDNKLLEHQMVPVLVTVC